MARKPKVGALMRRSRSKFKTARAAWSDISKATGLKARNVKPAGHTKKFWVWKRVR